ncbi:MAG: hypothetical protein IJF55_04390 [Clostridia bacterium]|nr:hypothetical protein [Clostridia bacterium]
MKKIITIIVACICTFGLIGCNQQQGDNITNYIKEENGKHYLILPISQTEVSVSDSCKNELNKIDIELLRAAEEAIRSEIPDSAEDPVYFLEFDSNRKLCLCAESIVYIDPPNVITNTYGETVISGCDIDHKHLFWCEPITE